MSMGVYIKGMELPKSCFDCNFCVEVYEGAGVYACVVTDKCVCRGAGRHDDCPLVPVSPHGRLIDADALIAWFEEWYDPNADLEICHVIDILDDNGVTPTILEAEEGE